MAVPIVVLWNLKDKPESLLDSRAYANVVYSLSIRSLISSLSVSDLLIDGAGDVFRPSVADGCEFFVGAVFAPCFMKITADVFVACIFSWWVHSLVDGF